jgi:predicted nucleotidyltransferase
MDRSTIIAKLQEHASELKDAGIEHLFLHGSYARGTAIRDVSDVNSSPFPGTLQRAVLQRG